MSPFLVSLIILSPLLVSFDYHEPPFFFLLIYHEPPFFFL